MNIAAMWRRLRAALGGRRMHDELAEEMRLHLELRALANRKAGMSEADAAFAARRRFGNPGLLAESSRDAWGWQWLDALRQDLRYGARQLRRAPGFAAVAVVTIGAALGLATCAFTVYDTFFLRPLPVHAPGEMVRVSRRGDRTTIDELPWSTVQLVRGARSLGALVVTSAPEIFVSGREGADPVVSARFVSPDYFRVLGVGMALGSSLGDQPDGIVVSHEFWERRLGADRGVLGRTLTVQGVPLTIVGVARRGYAGTGLPPAAPDLWAPLAAQPLLTPGRDWIRTDAEKWQILARRTGGVEQVNAELGALASRLPADSGRAIVLQARPATFFQADSGEMQTLGQISQVLMIAVGLILAIACFNIVNLLAARNAARMREVTMRLALGASRRRIARQLCTESALLGLLGGAVGLALSVWLSRALQLWIVGTLTRLTGGYVMELALDFSPDWRVFGGAAALALLTGIGVGLWPALRAARGDAAMVLKSGSTEGPEARGRRHLLLTLQVAACLVLLTGSGLLVQGVWRARGADPGFDATHLVIFDVDRSISPTPAARAALVRTVAERVGALPGIRSASWTDRAPYMGHSLRTLTDLRSHAPVTIAWNFVSPAFFDATGIGLVSGRGFTDEEAEQHRPVMVVSESVARRFWPGQDIVGRVMPPADWLAAPDSQSYTVIGIARDVRYTYLSKTDEGHEYFPAPATKANVFVVRTAGPAAAAMPAILTSLAALGRDVPAHAHVVTMEDGPLAVQRLMASAPATVAAILAGLSLLLSAVSIFGLVAHAVTRRTREIGVRVALGARTWQVLAMVLGEATLPVGWGALVGAAGAAGVSVMLAKALAQSDAPDLTYGGGVANPAVFAGVLLALGSVVALASVIPATRATRVDAMEALRQD